MKRILLYFLCAAGIYGSAWAQQISEVKAVGKKHLVEVSFQLNDAVADRWFRVEAYAIAGRDTIQMKSISGPNTGIGDSIQVGTYGFLWDAGKDMGRYRGRLSFQIRALPLFYFQAPAKEGLTLKRDKAYTFRWYGGNSSLDTLTVELYQFDKRVAVLDKIVNSASYAWKVPVALPTGENYRIKLLGTEYTGLDAFSPPFTVKRKVPLYQIIVPAAAVVTGVVTYLILRRVPLIGPPADLNQGDPVYETENNVPNG